ncbi:uncharacterized protein LOC114969454 [Acropora millepora]|uniref:uncharacterized protein LOC114969454 n=1 Tax=Acropora millepora TaxID=45264 RepID=UPI001CF21903|nr:uncharacterized protein LOC114969454 [Acropora millepora]
MSILGSTVWESLCFKMAVSKAVVSRVRVLAITHILVGVLLVVFGIADAVTQDIYGNHFNGREGFFGFATGLWMCIAGGLGIPASTPQRTQRRNYFAGIFMGFAITSAVCGGLIIIMYGTTLGTASCQRYCDPFDRDGYRHHNVTVGPKLQYTYSYETKLGLAAVILTLGIIEFGTGIWVSIYLCVMKPCCIVLEEREPLVNSVRG